MFFVVLFVIVKIGFYLNILFNEKDQRNYDGYEGINEFSKYE